MLIDKLVDMCYNNNSKRDKAKTKYIISLIPIITKRGEKVNRKNHSFVSYDGLIKQIYRKNLHRESLNRE